MAIVGRDPCCPLAPDSRGNPGALLHPNKRPSAGNRLNRKYRIYHYRGKFGAIYALDEGGANIWAHEDYGAH